MERKITLKELSKILKVSISTVSKGLSDSHEISNETKAKIRKTALATGYVPNESAQSLKGKKSKTIGVIIPDVLAHFFAKSLHGIETTASGNGYKIIVCISNESIEKESESIKTLINGGVNGIIMSLAKETQSKQNFDHLKKAIDLNIPMVLFDRVSERLPCDKIQIDDSQIAKKATMELFNSGCKSLLYLSTIFDTSVDKQRQIGFTSAAKENSFNPYYLEIKDYSTFEEKILDTLKNNPIDGILAADELSAISAIRIALKNGYKIPQDISVIGFTNGILGENYIPSLTTVEQNAQQQGQLATETMIGRIEKSIPKELVNRVIETSIIHRESTLPQVSQ